MVCDAAPQICYDSRGPSLLMTRMVYGDAASRRLLAQLSGRPPERQFLLSEGQLCDVTLRSCWDDGWRRRRFNTILSRHLFGASAQSPTGPAQPNPVPAPSAADRQCALMQRMRPVVSGRCTLSRQSEGFWTTYMVRLEGGQIYRFQRRGALLLLSDATGNWPVIVRDLGTSVQFRWADLQLEVAQAPMPRGATGQEMPAGQSPAPTPRSTGETSGDALDRIFP